MTRSAAPLRVDLSYLSNLLDQRRRISDNCVLLTVHSLSIVCNKGLAVANVVNRLFAGWLMPKRARAPAARWVP